MMHVILFHVGKGDFSLVLLPNGEAMMIDCYKADEAGDGEFDNVVSLIEKVESHILRHREMIVGNVISTRQYMLAEELEKEKNKTKKIRIALLAITHADSDHILASDKLEERFDISCLIEMYPVRLPRGSNSPQIQEFT